MEKPTSHQSGTFSSWGWKKKEKSQPLRSAQSGYESKSWYAVDTKIAVDPKYHTRFWSQEFLFDRLSAAVHPPGLSCTLWKSERTRAFSSSPRESQDLPETSTGGEATNGVDGILRVDSSDMSTCLMQDLYMFSMISIVDIRLYIYICYISSIKPPLCLATNNSLRHLCSTSVLDGYLTNWK